VPASLRSPSPAAGAPLTAKWIIAGVFAALWLLFAMGNASILLGVGAKPEKGRSMVPFIGGLAGAMACLASPYPLLGWA
jgi:hypothetical protein